MAVIGQFLQRFGTGARFGVAAVCGLALMTVPVLAQFGQFGGRGQSFDSFFSPYSAPRYRSNARSTTAARLRRGSPTFSRPAAACWCWAIPWPTGWPMDWRTPRRSARSGCRAEEPRQQRIDPLRFAQREGGLGAGDPRNDRRGQAEVRRDDGRAERSRLDPRSRGAVDPACGCRGENARAARRVRPGTAGGCARRKTRRRGRRADAGDSRRTPRPSRRPEAASPPRPIASTNSGPTNGPPRTPSGSMRRSPR